MKKIVLALALAAVTPAVLVAQENGNAYNQNTNEVIASNTQTQTSSVNYGLEGKALYHSDLALAKIRAERVAREKQEQTPTQPAKHTTAAPVQPAATPAKTSSQPVSITEYGPEGKMLSLSNRVLERRAKEQQENAVPTYVKEADTISSNHQVVLNSKSSEKSVKKSNSSFRRTLREVGSAIGHAIAQQAQYEK